MLCWGSNRELVTSPPANLVFVPLPRGQVYLVTEAPEWFLAEGEPHYYRRGWCAFEYQLAWLAKLSDEYNVWPQARVASSHLP